MAVELSHVATSPAPSSPSDREITELRKQVADLQSALQAARATPTSPPKNLTAPKEVYRELLRLESATQTGLNYPQYCERLLNAKSKIEATLPRVQNYTFRNRVEKALAIYMDARDLWFFFLTQSYHQLSPLERSQFEPYQLSIIEDKYVSSSQVPVIWSHASAIIDGMGTDYSGMLR